MVVYETCQDGRAAGKRGRQLNSARDASDRKFITFEVREKELIARFCVCHVPSINDGDSRASTDRTPQGRGYETREEAGRQARENSMPAEALDAEEGVTVVGEIS